jgi:hypothetical protein
MHQLQLLVLAHGPEPVDGGRMLAHA